MDHNKCRIKQGVFQHWIIVNADLPDLAWTGSRWATHDRGVPTGDIQIVNFQHEEVARQYAAVCGLEVIR